MLYSLECSFLFEPTTASQRQDADEAEQNGRQRGIRQKLSAQHEKFQAQQQTLQLTRHTCTNASTRPPNGVHVTQGWGQVISSGVVSSKGARLFAGAHLDDGNDERAERRRTSVKPQALLQGRPERAVGNLRRKRGGREDGQPVDNDESRTLLSCLSQYRCLSNSRER